MGIWWRTAEFHEQEAHDLRDPAVVGHPDLRRLFMTDDWKGWPFGRIMDEGEYD